LRFKFTLTMAAYDLIGCRTCLARPRDRQKVVQNGIDTDQSGNHELARVQRHSPRAVGTNFSGLLDP
jgi:hypothetical protein